MNPNVCLLEFYCKGKMKKVKHPGTCMFFEVNSLLALEQHPHHHHHHPVTGVYIYIYIYNTCNLFLFC